MAEHRCGSMNPVWAFGNVQGRTSPAVRVKVFSGLSRQHFMPVGRRRQPQPDGWKLQVASDTPEVLVLVAISNCPFCGEKLAQIHPADVEKS